VIQFMSPLFYCFGLTQGQYDEPVCGAPFTDLMPRTVPEKPAKVGLSTRKDRTQGWVNLTIGPWLVFSPRNGAVIERARRAVTETKQGLLLEQVLGGRQR
jgi:hypothetical protein